MDRLGPPEGKQMTSRLRALCVRACDPPRLAAFWARLLDWEVDSPAGTELRPTDDTGFGMRFLPTTEPRVGMNQMHVHLTSTSPEHQLQTVARALELGARHLDVGQLADEEHVVLADPEGNEFCVIEAGNTPGLPVAGSSGSSPATAPGPPAASGPRRWPGPFCGTRTGRPQSARRTEAPKIAWGGPPLNERHGPSRMALDLVATDGDLQAEADRLVSLGATLVENRRARVVLADPDGNEFCVLVP